MIELHQMHCEACRAGAPQVTEEELAELMKEISNWHPIMDDGIMKLQRVFKFSNFVDAMAFGQSVGELAEANGHHPAILIEWGEVTITWWTHKIKGLHKTDFIMAAKTDQL